MSAPGSPGIPISCPHLAVPGVDLAYSVGGTVYGTTPGGHRYVYDKQTLLKLRNSPLAKTPPVGLPLIPGITLTSDDTTKSDAAPPPPATALPNPPVSVPTPTPAPAEATARPVPDTSSNPPPPTADPFFGDPDQ